MRPQAASPGKTVAPLTNVPLTSATQRPEQRLGGEWSWEKVWSPP